MTAASRHIPPSRKDVEAQLGRILASEDFRRSARLSAFLDFVVRRTLAGDEDKLKAYVIGVEVYGKPADFDADNDASIRVEAGRLRKALSLYYHTEGKSDPVVIEVPTGAYKAVFRRGGPPAADPARSGRIFAVAAVVVFAIALVAVLWGAPALRVPAPQAAEDAALPVIAVVPFHVIGGTRAAEAELSLNAAVVKALSAFDTLVAVSARGAADAPGGRADSFDVAGQHTAQYIVEGTLRNSGGIAHVAVRLLDTKKRQYIWSFTRDYGADGAYSAELEAEIVGNIVSQVASPGGVIETLEEERLPQLRGPAAERQKCFVRYYAYSNNKTPEEHTRILGCLEEAVRREPGNAAALAYLSWIYGDKVRYDFNLAGTREEAAKKSLDTARRALAAAPRSARTHQYLANAAMLVRDYDLVKRHLDIAYDINPYNSEILADMAWNYGQMGEWDRVEEPGLKAVALNPAHPRWYEGILSAYYFERGEDEKSLSHGLAFYHPDDLMSNLLVAAAYVRLGRAEDAARIARHVERAFPAFVENPGEMMQSWAFQPDFNRALLEAARAAGIRMADGKSVEEQ